MIGPDEFHGIYDVPAPQPPTTTTGPALLEAHERDGLDDFLNKIGNGNLDSNILGFEGIGPDKGNTDNISWTDVDDLPPLFHGSATSLPPTGTRPTTSLHRDNFHSFGYGQHHRYSEEYPQTSANPPEVLAAASTLVNNSNIGNDLYPSITSHHDELLQSPSGLTYSQYHGRSPFPTGLVGSYPYGSPNVSGGLRSFDAALLDTDPVLRNMFFGPVQNLNIQHPNIPEATHLQWGSDTGFYGNGFIPPPEQKTEAEVSKEALSQLECFEPSFSAGNTQPSSPVMSRVRYRTSRGRKRSTSPMPNDTKVEALGNDSPPHLVATTELGPSKRRRGLSKPKIENPGESVKVEARSDGKEEPSSQARAKKHSSKKSKSKVQSPVVQDRGKKGKVANGEQKFSRDNLTDEQKRSNHIFSEQKRRNLIKQGFEDLCEMIPTLHDGGFSKSAMLTQAVDWLQDLLQGNERLRLQLKDMGVDN